MWIGPSFQTNKISYLINTSNQSLRGCIQLIKLLRVIKVLTFSWQAPSQVPLPYIILKTHSIKLMNVVVKWHLTLLVLSRGSNLWVQTFLIIIVIKVKQIFKHHLILNNNFMKERGTNSTPKDTLKLLRLKGFLNVHL